MPEVENTLFELPVRPEKQTPLAPAPRTTPKTAFQRHDLLSAPMFAGPQRDPATIPDFKLKDRVYVVHPDQTGTILQTNEVAFWVEFDRCKMGCWYPASMLWLLEDTHA